MRTTLKRGVGRAGVLDGNGRSMLPPSALTPVSRYRQPEPPPRPVWRVVGRVLGWLLGAIAMLAVAFVGGIYLFFHESVGAIQAHSPELKTAQKYLSVKPPKGAAIALIVGYDKRAGKEADITGRSDTVMLLRADPATNTISMLSFPRDLIVDVTCPGRPVYAGRINAAYADCGPKGTLLTVQKLIGGLPINYLITVNFRGFKQIVNRLGGVWVDIDRRYFNNNAGLGQGFTYATINLDSGYQRLTGGAALDYVRFRHTDSDLYRVARQQQFVKAMKYQLQHRFGLTTIPKLIGAVTHNVEVGVGGGGKLSGSTVLSYALFAYNLPGGHFFQSKIEGLTGYSELHTDPSNITAAVQQWESPDVEAPKIANGVALGQKVRTATPPPGETTVTVLNGNGVPGSAGNGGYALSQRGYRVLTPPPNATGNAPSFGYFHTKAYWNPAAKRGKAAAQAVAKLFAPAEAEAAPGPIRRLAHGAMVTVVVGSTFKGSIAPAPASDAPTKREPPHVTPNPYDTATQLRAVRRRAGFPLLEPTVVDSASAPDPEQPLRVYKIQGAHGAVRLVFKNGATYWGIQETDWKDAPILQDRSFRRVIGGRRYDLYYDGPHLHMVVLNTPRGSYWVVNTLLDDLSNETMIAIAKGLKPLKSI
jgi:LCP family protein required for cell wall assembly